MQLNESYQLQGRRAEEWRDLSPPASDLEALVKNDFKDSRLATCLGAGFSRVRIVSAASGEVVKEVDLHDWKRAQETKKLIRTIVIVLILAVIVFSVVAIRPF